MRAALRRLTSVPASHAPKIGPELWSSDSFKKRLQTLRENAVETRDFPRSLYPLVPRGVKLTPIREFVESFGEFSAEDLRTAPEKTAFTLNGTVLDMVITPSNLSRKSESYSKTGKELGVCKSPAG
jgi:hypothetical protein